MSGEELLMLKKLQSRVEELQDAVAIMRRKYDDILANLTEENFGASIIREKDNMQSQINITADEISTKVSKEDMDGKLTDYSTITQTAQKIETAVHRAVKIAGAVVIEHIPDENCDKSRCYKYGDDVYYYNTVSDKWEVVENAEVSSMFKQTADGFELIGSVYIDGNTTITKNLTLSGNVTWDLENSPVKTQYSSDMKSWHDTQQDGDSYIQMSFDGGRTWSNATRIIGKDGKNGTNGSDANVTAQNVFNALTGDGDEQGLFAAFYKGSNKLFINAEYIKTGIMNADRIDTDNLGCTRLYHKNNKNGYYAKINSNCGDIGLYSKEAGELSNPLSDSCVWGVYTKDPVTENINLYIKGHNYFGYSTNQNQFFAKGVWNFGGEDCTVLGLENSVTVIPIFG